MSLTLTLIVTILILLVILFFCAKIGAEKNKKLAELESEKAEQKQNILALIDHIEHLSKIVADKDETSQKIQGAKTDEEVESIISDIIAFNNSRVQNNKTEK